jgi:hypothetical protein
MDLPKDVRRTYSLLLGYSRSAKGSVWWRCDIGEVGAQVDRILGRDPPQHPWGWNLTDRQAPLISAADRLQATQLLERHLKELQEAGLWRWVFPPTWGELYIAG